MRRPFRYAPPSVAQTAVVRPRLLSALAGRFALRLVTVQAGAGLGKTTLLAQAVADNQSAPSGRDCWLTCEPADSSASSLVGGLLEALGVPDAGQVPALGQVCEAVWAASPQHVCLVLDDVHNIEHGSPGETVVRQLLDDLPENGHLLLAGRRLPSVRRGRLLVEARAT